MNSKKVELFGLCGSLFLLYVSIIYIMLFLQQEFIFLPKLQNLDIIGEDTKAILLDKINKNRWTNYVAPPILLFIRLSLVSLCLYIGGFFFPEIGRRRYHYWWKISIIAQPVLLLYNLILCVINLIYQTDKSVDIKKYTSLCFLGENLDSCFKIPLTAINIFEILYWIIMSLLIRKFTKTTFGQSFKFVLSTYGVGYLFYVAFLMFFVLYIS